jgi:hypothetical protein
MQPLQEPALLGLQRQRIAALNQRIEAGEQSRIALDRRPMRGQPRRQPALDRLQCGRGVRSAQAAEDRLDARQQPAAAIERRGGVVERRRLGPGGDAFYLGAMRGKRDVERRLEVAGLDPFKRRQAQVLGPALQQRVVLLVDRVAFHFVAMHTK